MKIDIDKDFGIVITLNKTEKEIVINDLTDITRKVWPFIKWYENSKTSKEDKEKYEKKYNNAKLSMGWAGKVWKTAGCTEEEIKKRLKS